MIVGNEEEEEEEEEENLVLHLLAFEKEEFHVACLGLVPGSCLTRACFLIMNNFKLKF